MLLERLGDLFTKNLCHNVEVFFIRYMNNIESNIDESDLICIKAKSYRFLEATSHAIVSWKQHRTPTKTAEPSHTVKITTFCSCG
jgi:hypothetical protein